MDGWNISILFGWLIFRCELLVLGRARQPSNSANLAPAGSMFRTLSKEIAEVPTKSQLHKDRVVRLPYHFHGYEGFVTL